MSGVRRRRWSARSWRSADAAARWARFGRGAAVVAALVVAVFTLLPAPPAAAHPTLVATTPPAGYAVVQAPREVVLDFGEAVGLVPDAVRLTAADGREVAIAAAVLSANGRRMTAGVLGVKLGPGVYQVSWQVRGEDGDLVSGRFSFAVGASVLDAAGLAAGAGGGPAADVNVLAAVLRWVLYAALALGLGGAAGTWLAGRVRREAARVGVALGTVPAPAVTASALGFAAVAGLVLDGGYRLDELLGSRPGQLMGIELAAFATALALAGAARAFGRPRLRSMAVAVLLVVVAAEALRAHVAVLAPLGGGLLTAVHLVAASLWTGGLAQVLRAVLRWRGQAGWARLLLFDYARVAVWLVAVLVVTGTVQSVLLVPTAAELVGTGYGRMLLAKLAVVLLVIGAAVLARAGLRRRLRPDTPPPADPPLPGTRVGGRAVRVEITALVGVLALTGTLTSLTPPAQAAAGAALPPPPVGPAIPVGTLAGQVTVAATASAGRLVLRLTTPLDGPYDDPPQSPPYRASVRAAGENLALIGCGTGCYTAPVDWRPGSTELTVEVNAPPWVGGTARLDIAWPPRPATDRLASVLAAMRATESFTLSEAATSDFRGDPGPVREFPMTGADFIAREPYAEGAIDPVAVSDADGDQLAFAYPANGIVVRLWLDTQDRITRQALVSPNHLITRTFGYSAGPGGSG